jgi:plasmid stability protein
MPQLIVRGLEEKLVRKLKERAGAQGVSVEEAHRQILKKALLKPEQDFKAFLLSIPKGGPDDLFDREQDYGREVKF